MKSILDPAEIVMLRSVFRRHPKVTEVQIFGSRAKGTHTERSDVDLALFGDLTHLEGQAIAAELDELPLPYKYDVQVFDLIREMPLRDHIRRVGISLYPEVRSGIDLVASQDSVSEIEARYGELVSGRRDLWTTLRSLPAQETRALMALGLSQTNGNYREVAARFHVGAQEYRRFMDFLRRHNCLVDFRPYRKLVQIK
jgi:predicted nucleotidyltransferase